MSSALSSPAPETVLSTSAAELARRLAEAGHYRQAIDLLSGENPETIDLVTLRDLVVWRNAAFEPGLGRPIQSPNTSDPFPGFQGVPEIDGAALTADILDGAIRNHGGLLVRGIIDAEQSQKLAEVVRHALKAAEASLANPMSSPPPSPWYAPYPLPPGEEMTEAGRAFVTQRGSIWTVDSPRALFDFVAFLKAHGVISIIEDYFGERAYLSVGKSTLRRVLPTTFTNWWHQDGAFLGRDIRTVNCWLALSDCGEDAPGLEIYPRRLDELVEAGTRDAAFEWSVGDNVVDDMARTTPILSPRFRAGDALLFDQLFLHRTGIRPGMTKERLAIETWFFAGSTFPMKQIPIALS